MKVHFRFTRRLVSLLVIIAFSGIPLGATSLKMVNLADMVGHSD